ncbi:MAG: alpha/beta fold hydrolase [Rubricella sp.]
MILGGVETGLLEQGEAGPRLLLSHCSLAHSGAWKPLLAALPPVRAAAPDLPGHGRTERDRARTAERQGADALLALLDGEPSHLIGHSFGARVALRAALDRPDAVLSLTLVEPMMFHLLDDAGDPLFDEEWEASVEWGRALEAGNSDTAARLFLALWGNGERWEDIPPRQQGYIKRCMPHVFEAGPEVMGHPPGQITLDEIAALTPPLTLIGGGLSRPGALAIMRLIEEASGAPLYIVEEAGHMVPITHPEACAAVLAPVLSRPSSR